MSDPDPPKPAVYLVTLRGLPDSVPPAIRLRRFLKLALRGFGLRCVRVEEIQADGPESGPARPPCSQKM